MSERFNLAADLEQLFNVGMEERRVGVEEDKINSSANTRRVGIGLRKIREIRGCGAQHMELSTQITPKPDEMGIGFKCDDDVAAVVICASSEPLSLAYRPRLTAWGGSLFAIPPAC